MCGHAQTQVALRDGFPLEPVLDRQSSRLATAHAAWPRSRRASGGPILSAAEAHVGRVLPVRAAVIQQI
jgi:hypothetical protein